MKATKGDLITIKTLSDGFKIDSTKLTKDDKPLYFIKTPSELWEKISKFLEELKNNERNN